VSESSSLAFYLHFGLRPFKKTV